MPQQFLIVSQSTLLIQINKLNDKHGRSRSTADLDLHCLKRQGISGFSRARVKMLFPSLTFDPF